MAKFGIKWFKEKLAEWSGATELEKENQRLREEIENAKKKVFESNSQKTEEQKPYLKATLSNNTLVVVTKDGEDLLIKHNSNKQDLEKVKTLKTEKEVIEFMTYIPVSSSVRFSEEKEEEEDKKIDKKITTDYPVLIDSGDFEFKDKSLYLKGIDRSIPPLLAAKFVDLYEIYNHIMNKESCTEGELEAAVKAESEIIGHKRFWMWCCLNPYPKVADSLYSFLKKGEFKITKDGMFLGYRRVWKVNQNTDISNVEAISTAYTKIKSVWKKKPAKFELYENDQKDLQLKELDKGLVKEGYKLLGNLQDLYDSISEIKENRFTDNYTKKMDIRIGKAVNIPRSTCTHNTLDCATGGLHFANKHYNYYTFGDTGILMLVNPYNVVGLGTEKGRCSEYLPLCTISPDEEKTILDDPAFDSSELHEYYAQEQLKDLEERVKTDFAIESKKYSIKDSEDGFIRRAKDIIQSLESLKSQVADRVVSINK